MLNKQYIDKIVWLVMGIAVVITLAFMNGESFGIVKKSSVPVYMARLFDDSRVHQIDILIDDWDGFLDTAMDETYHPATVVIDGERFSNIGLRTKGNNSLRISNKYGSDRYSLKLEFDHYTSSSYHGLDKFSLDSSFQDNSYLKSYLAYDMMAFMDVPSPLTSYTWVTVNGEPWGLFLAVEEPEEAFARRNFGLEYGQLYKPDYKYLADENADVALKYIDNDIDSYDNIFRKAKFSPTEADKRRLIGALDTLASGVDLESAVDIETVLKYFAVQVFVVNLDSYLGRTGHNYFLYEEDGQISMLPWDYNLAFGTYSLGMPNPINDAELYVNSPIFTPAAGDIMMNRPLYHNLMKYEDSFVQYQAHFDQFISDYFESGHFEEKIDATAAMIAPYVEMDPTAYISYEDHLLGVETIKQFSLLRAESIRGQLDGKIPGTIKGQAEDKSQFIDASSVWLPDMGEIADLKD